MVFVRIKLRYCLYYIACSSCEAIYMHASRDHKNIDNITKYRKISKSKFSKHITNIVQWYLNITESHETCYILQIIA